MALFCLVLFHWQFTWVAFTKLDEHDEEEDEPEEEFDGGELVLTDSRLMFMASTIDHSAKFETDGAAKKKPPTCWSDFLDRITPKWYTEWQEKKKAEEEEERKLKEAKAKAKGAKVSSDTQGQRTNHQQKTKVLGE